MALFRLNLPPSTRVFLSCLVGLSFLYNVARWRLYTLASARGLDKPHVVSPSDLVVPYMTVVPSSFLFYPWTLFSATFVEQNIFTLVLNAATLLYGGKYLERAWGSFEFSKFIVVVALIPNIVSLLIYLTWAAVSGDTNRGYAPLFLYSKKKKKGPHY